MHSDVDEISDEELATLEAVGGLLSARWPC
jgi:hypothetical protein